MSSTVEEELRALLWRRLKSALDCGAPAHVIGVEAVVRVLGHGSEGAREDARAMLELLADLKKGKVIQWRAG